MASISNNEIKRVKSLQQKKFRDEYGLFTVEGEKMVEEALHSRFAVENVYRRDEIGEETMKRISALASPSPVLAVLRKPSDIYVDDISSFAESLPAEGLYLGLDTIRDPGNLGTILRIADWFGIKNIYCSLDTADVWNPKVVQATMGSIARVAVRYQPLTELLDTLPPDFPVYGTMLDGDDISETKFNSCGIIVMGNEGNGISPDIAQRLNHRVLIPNFPKGEPTADSLNVAIATAITCFVARNAK